MLRSLRHVIHSGHGAKRWVGVCGEMAGDPRTAVLLSGMGVDELSVSCFDLPRVKAAIRSVPAIRAREVADQALALDSADEVRRLLHAELDALLPDYLAWDGAEA